MARIQIDRRFTIFYLTKDLFELHTPIIGKRRCLRSSNEHFHLGEKLSHFRYGAPCSSLLLIESRHKKNIRCTIKDEMNSECSKSEVADIVVDREEANNNWREGAPVLDNATPRLVERARNQLGCSRIA